MKDKLQEWTKVKINCWFLWMLEESTFLWLKISIVNIQLVPYKKINVASQPSSFSGNAFMKNGCPLSPYFFNSLIFICFSIQCEGLQNLFFTVRKFPITLNFYLRFQTCHRSLFGLNWCFLTLDYLFTFSFFCCFIDALF